MARYRVYDVRAPHRTLALVEPRRRMVEDACELLGAKYGCALAWERYGWRCRASLAWRRWRPRLAAAGVTVVLVAVLALSGGDPLPR
jgi:hypothetical protein